VALKAYLSHKAHAQHTPCPKFPAHKKKVQEKKKTKNGRKENIMDD
jgi:hypothetical protein